jgi:hypothetical protein
MAEFEGLSNAELRKKLLQHGLDLPISINRDFLIRKLEGAIAAGRKGSSSGSGTPTPGRRQTLGPQRPTLEPDKESAEGAKASKRLSLGLSPMTTPTPTPTTGEYFTFVVSTLGLW